MFGRDVIVVGASAAGVDAIPQLDPSLPGDLPASALGPELLPHIMRRNASLSVAHGVDKERIRHGHVYITPPDYHLQPDGARVRLSHGPRENFHRQSKGARKGCRVNSKI